MPDSESSQTISIAGQLFAEPWEFEFFQAVLLLEQLQPSSVPAGEGVDPDREAVCFRSAVTQVFAASEVQALEHAADSGAPPTITANLFSLGGAAGPLPEAYSGLLIESSWRKNFAMRDFLDIFHHRLLSLLVRGRKAHHPSYTPLAPHESPFARYLFAFFGMALDECRNRMRVPDRSLIHYSGILSQHPRSASGLERLLGDYFKIAARVNQLLGQWRALEPSTWTRIGARGGNQALGQTALLGTRIWDQQGRFEVCLGPLSLKVFLDLLPQGSGFEPLCELTRFYAGPEFEFGFRLTLRAVEVPPTRLGGTRLGWTSWLKTRPFQKDDSQVRLSSRPPFNRAAVFAAVPGVG
jgi:type VI secretion system protein ImpH